MIYDISPPIVPGIVTWPGDAVYSEAWTMRLGPQCPVNVSQIALSTHTGAHADAPFHFDDAGAKIGAIDPSRYIGPCLLLEVSRARGLVQPEDISHLGPDRIDRVLLRTESNPDLTRWNRNFTAVADRTIEWLADRGVRLIGIDTPSLDPESSKDLPAHKAAVRRGMLILEGLILAAVPPGNYELIALPLKLMNLDASPVRAVLRTLTK